MKRRIAGSIIFVIIVAVLFIKAQSVFTVSNNLAEHAEMMMNGFYETEEDSVDAVLIGNSHIYRYWQPAFGWEQNGIATTVLSTSDMPCSVIKYMGIEVLKTQKPKVLVFDALAFADNISMENNKIYYITSHMKFSRNYIDTVEAYCDAAELQGMDRMAVYFPIIQFHTRWDELHPRDFYCQKEGYLNSCYEKIFVNNTIEKCEPVLTDERVPVSEGHEEALIDLLEWCKEQDIAIEFMAVPTLLDEERVAMLNYVEDIVTSYGIPFVNCNDPEMYESFGFVEEEDFQDKSHTNVKGSYKFCDVYGDYLMETYGLPVRKGDAKYELWTQKTREYYRKLEEVRNQE